MKHDRIGAIASRETYDRRSDQYVLRSYFDDLRLFADLYASLIADNVPVLATGNRPFPNEREEQ